MVACFMPPLARVLARSRAATLVLVSAVVVLAAAVVAPVAGGAGGAAAGETVAAPAATLHRQAPQPPPAETALERAVEGLPQHGPWLGRAEAPVVVELYADLQCARCRQFAQQTLPRLVRSQVASGTVRLRFRFLTRLGRDSVRTARLSIAAGEQRRLWQTAAQLLANQGQAQSGYATDDYLREIARRVRGLDADAALTTARADAMLDPLRATRRSARLLGVETAPALAIGRRGGPLRRFDGNPARLRELAAAIDAARRG